jgi:hypothetical protein
MDKHVFGEWRVMVRLRKSKLFDRRVSQSRASLESAIAEAVKAEPDCEAFVGVVVMPKEPKSRFEANWSIKGVKFGKANRDKSSRVLAGIVERMQREFRLSEDSSAVASATQSEQKPSNVEVSAAGTGENQDARSKSEPHPEKECGDDLNGKGRP